MTSELRRFSVLFRRHVWCFSAHAEHRTWSGDASLVQPLQIPAASRSRSLWLFVFGSRSGILNGCSKTFLLGQLVVFSQSYERGSILVTTNLPFDEWTEVFGSERLTGALLDRLTHHVHIIEMNGDSYRLKASRQNAVSSPPEEPADA